MTSSEQSTEVRQQRDESVPYPNALYAWFVVGVLMLAYIVSYVDRSILTLLVDPIKRDLGISDVQVSLLHGLAFAIFYSVLGFPIGRISDTRNRTAVISIGIGLWSIMTALCGVAKSFGTFFLARIGVGVGEAALNPAAYSIITDYFPKEKLARAISTYVMGTYLGFGVAYIVGGVVVNAISGLSNYEVPILGTIYPWQLAFFIVAAPGVLLIMIMLAVKEPFRRGRMNTDTAEVKSIPFNEVWQFIKLHRRTFFFHATGYGCLGILVNGMALWTPTFLTRTYGWESADTGFTYGFILLIFGGGGVYCGGFLADLFEKRKTEGAAMKVAALSAGLAILPGTLYPLMPSATLSLVFLAPMVFFSSAPWGIAVSAIQQFTPNELRGQISALMYLFPVNLIGIGFGPSLVAAVTDYGFGDPQDLHYSMSIITAVAGSFSMLLLWRGIRYFKVSVREAAIWKD